MHTKILEMPYPDDLPEALRKTPEEFEQELRFLIAAKLYEMARISSGRAAVLAGVGRIEFLNNLPGYRISAFNYSLKELEREIEEARARVRRGS